MPDPVIPYCGPAPEPEALWSAWNTDPVLLVFFAVMLAPLAVLPRNRGAWLLGWLVLLLAFVSPLCALTIALFSARAAHHLLLVTLAAPLLALALPGRRNPAAALGVLLLALVLWHLPPVYAAAWESVLVYWLMQALLLVPAVLFWSGLRWLARTDILAASGQLAALAGLMGFIGAVLTFAPRLLYPQHGMTTYAFGLEPLRDQQLAGLIMWAPGLVPLALIAGLMLRGAWSRAARAA